MKKAAGAEFNVIFIAVQFQQPRAAERVSYIRAQQLQRNTNSHNGILKQISLSPSPLYGQFSDLQMRA